MLIQRFIDWIDYKIYKGNPPKKEGKKQQTATVQKIKKRKRGRKKSILTTLNALANYNPHKK
jgi:hypothetical protein